MAFASTDSNNTHTPRKGRGYAEVSLTYFPVSSSLKKFAEKAGNYLHAAQKPIDEASWKKLGSDAKVAMNTLEKVLSSNLLGPIMSNKNGEAVMNIELINDPSLSKAVDKIRKGKELSMKISYFKVE